MTNKVTSTKERPDNLTGSPWDSASFPWDEIALRHLFKVENGSTPKSGVEEYWDGDIPWATPKDIKKIGDGRLQSTNRTITQEGYDSCGTTLVPQGSIILTTRAPIGNLALAETDMCTNQGCKSLVPKQDAVNSRFYYHVLLAARQYLEILGEGATFNELGTDDLRGIHVPYPPHEKQELITSYIDHQTARIDKLVNKKQELLNLLEEKQHAKISQLITNGVISNPVTKSPSSKWLNEIPAHWDVLRLDHLTKEHNPIVYGIVLPGPNQKEGVPIIKGGDCKPENLDPEKLSKTTPEIASDYQRSRLQPGELVFEIRGSVGRVVKVPPELEGANLTQDTARISPKENINANWLIYALQSETFRQQIDLKTRGATVQGINLYDLRRGVLPVPPLEEQNKIAHQLQQLDERTQELSQLLTEGISLLQEKRHALTIKTITGQIDLSDWQPPDEQEALA